MIGAGEIVFSSAFLDGGIPTSETDVGAEAGISKKMTFKSLTWNHWLKVY